MWVQQAGQPLNYYNLARADGLVVTGSGTSWFVEVASGANVSGQISGPLASQADAEAVMVQIVTALGSFGAI